MTEAVAAILAQVEQLSVDERAELLDLLNLTSGPEKEQVGPEWEAELAQRVENIRAGRVVGRPAGEVFARLRAKRS